jgi:predicted chitinase
MKAYKKLPEYNALMFAKKRQAMFAALVDNESSIDHIQDLVNYLVRDPLKCL